MDPNNNPSNPLPEQRDPQNQPQPEPPQPTSQPTPQPLTYQPPAPQAPAQPQPPLDQFAQQPTTPQPTVAGSSTVPQKRNKNILLIIGIIVLILIGIGMITAILLHKSSTTSGSTNNNTAQVSQLSLLGQYGSHLQPTDIAKFDKNALFFAVFKKASMQTVVGTTVDRYLGSSAQDQTTRSNEFIHQSTYNYQTKAIATAMSDTRGTYFVRCINDHYYNYDTAASSWKVGSATDDSTTCTPDSYVFSINDGFNTGGLSESQSNTFISTLQSKAGLVTVDDMKYVTHSGAPFIRLVVSVHPQLTSIGYSGMGYFLTAFGKTGLDLQQWPYESLGSIVTGAKLIYYINPATQLPAYSQAGLTYRLDDTGKQQLPDSVYDFQDTVYSFSGTVPTLSASGAPQVFKLSWPEELMQ